MQELLLPQAFVAVQVRIIEYVFGQTTSIFRSLKSIVGIWLQLFIAKAVPVFSGEVLSVQLTFTSSGHVRTGARTEIIVLLHVLLHPSALKTVTE